MTDNKHKGSTHSVPNGNEVKMTTFQEYYEEVKLLLAIN